MGNQALDINPPGGARHLTTNGSNWLWAVTAIFLFVLLIIAALSLKPFHNERIFHHLFTIALLVATICYFAMASDLAWVVVPTSNHDTTRYPSYQIFWAKYVHWVVSFPVIVIALGLISGLSWAGILYGVFLAWAWIISYLMSALTSSNYKWGFFAFGTLAYLALAVHTFFGGWGGARRLGVRGHFGSLAGWANLMWLLYPIAFGVSDGGNVIGVTGSFIFFGILDLLLVPVMALAFISLSRKWDHGLMNLQFTQYGRAPGADGAYTEKGMTGAHSAGTHATTTHPAALGTAAPTTTPGHTGVTGPAAV